MNPQLLARLLPLIQAVGKALDAVGPVIRSAAQKVGAGIGALAIGLAMQDARKLAATFRQARAPIFGAFEQFAAAVSVMKEQLKPQTRAADSLDQLLIPRPGDFVRSVPVSPAPPDSTTFGKVEFPQVVGGKGTFRHRPVANW